MDLKLNNKGLSLVELIIAVAIAAVVSTLIITMIVSSSNMFSRESKVIDGQNEKQIVQNQITDRLREAKEIHIVKCGDAVRIYTGAIDKSTNKLLAESETGKYTDCIITYIDNKLYVTNKYMENIPEGYLLSDKVTQFEVALLTEAEEYTEQVTDVSGNPVKDLEGNIQYVTKSYYDNPITVSIKMDIGSGDDKKDADISVRMRNEIDVYATYSVSRINDALSGATATELDLR